VERAAQTASPNGQYTLELRVEPLFGRRRTALGATILAPICRTIRPRALGTKELGHDVSGTGWQTSGRRTQPMTTMTPVRQCGHSRKDRPVNASNRSR
jgi:hypothetical protein